MEVPIDLIRGYLLSNPMGFLGFCLFQLVLFNLVLVAIGLALKRRGKKSPRNPDELLKVLEETRRRLTRGQAEVEHLRVEHESLKTRLDQMVRQERSETATTGNRRYAVARNLCRKGYDLTRIADETNLSYGEIKFIMDLERLNGKKVAVMN